MDHKNHFAAMLVTVLAMAVCLACAGITIKIGPDDEDQAPPAAVEPAGPVTDTHAEAAPNVDANPQPNENSGAAADAGGTDENDAQTQPEITAYLSELDNLMDAGAQDMPGLADIADLLAGEAGVDWAALGAVPADIPAIPTTRLPTDISGIAIYENLYGDRVMSWYDYNRVAVGSSTDLGRDRNFIDGCYRDCYYQLPGKKTPQDVIDIAAVEMDEILYYFTDGTVSFGSPWKADNYKSPQAFSLPPGKKASDIVGIASTCGPDGSMRVEDATVYAWYDDGTVSAGSYLDLDSYRAPYVYTLPAGKSIDLILAMAIACTDDHVYVWYWDGTVSSGMSNDLGMYRDPAPFTTP